MLQKWLQSIKKKLEGEVVSWSFFLLSFHPYYHSFVASDYQQKIRFGNSTLLKWQWGWWLGVASMHKNWTHIPRRHPLHQSQTPIKGCQGTYSPRSRSGWDLHFPRPSGGRQYSSWRRTQHAHTIQRYGPPSHRLSSLSCSCSTAQTWWRKGCCW